MSGTETAATTAEHRGIPALSTGERWLAAAAALSAGAVGGLGLASSFDAVSAAAERWGFGAPWMLPVGIDVAIPVFTVANLLLIRMGMPLGWVRFVPWALTAVTCWLNVAAGESLSAKVAHGTMPLLWVVLSEIAAHIYAVRIGAATGARMERIRRSRWLLSPIATFALWRRMVLWETTSYRDALARERERQLLRAELRERHGRNWRRTAPRRTRVLLKLGELAPDEAVPEPATPDRPALPPAPPKEAPKPRATGARKGRRPQGKRSFEELLTQAREATAQWPAERLAAEPIRTELRCSPANARRLRETLRAERVEGKQRGPVGVAA
ncbi:hypothetical protein GCM10023347_27190 [Streptomyces chumphonensis]|uniref:DUF2637 domain-containing protein n=1 Tax=Streptomyces chumphonensis TaxID=1214925 RepID=UPI002963DA8D|nr:DUF2637 domain-containing protein [Streptomyces chumphonensis]